MYACTLHNFNRGISAVQLNQDIVIHVIIIIFDRFSNILLPLEVWRLHHQRYFLLDQMIAAVDQA